MGEFADERIDLAQRERGGRLALEVAPEEAVVGDAEFQGGRTGGLDDGDAVLLDEGQDAEDPADTDFAVAAVNAFAERADVATGPPRAREQRQRRRGGAGGPIVGVDGMAAPGLAAVLAQQDAGGGIEEADMLLVPLDGDFAAEPSWRRRVVGAGNLDAAVEMHRAGAELVVAEGLQGQGQQRRPFLGEHRRDLALGGAVNTRVGPARLPAIEIRLGFFQALETQALEWRRLCMAHRRLHLALPIRRPDAAGQREGAVVLQHIAVERVEGGIVDVGREHTLAQVIEDDDADGAPESAKRLFVQLGPAPRAGGEGEQAHALTAVAEGEHEQAGAAVLPRERVPHHGALAVVDLPFLPRRGDDHRVSLRRALSPQRDHETPNAGVARGKAMLIDQVLPDRHGVAAAAEGERDQLPIRLAGAGDRGAAGGRGPHGQVGQARRQRAGVGGHLTGRLWQGSAAPGRADCDPGGLEIGARRLATDAGRLFDTPERPAQPPQGQNLLLSVVSQDVGHADGESTLSTAASTSWGAATSLAGFQVSTTGRFWVSTEVSSFWSSLRTCALA